MIRQAITCDICAAEKKQTNHWFVAYEQSGELRVTGWSTRHRLRPGTMHLCGQTCLHKLVDDFMARTVAARIQAAAAESGEPADEIAPTDASLTSSAAYGEFESSARLLTPPAPVPSAPIPPALAYKAQAGLVAIPARAPAEPAELPAAEPPRYASRTWRAEAWEREREREMRTEHPGFARRRSRA